ncbi:MAG TPA: SPOR domain-containing protein [Rhodocyclaceae bacterium]|nr:SPOR domain-containing protein [Rhodocyclaceae bacterium]
MKKLRSAFFLMAAINLVLAAILLAPVFGLQDIDHANGEPERLNNQLNTESIRVLPQGFESTPAATPAALAAPVCVAYDNLNSDQAKLLTARAQGLGETVNVREEGGTPSYWVNIPPQGGKQGAERRSAQLKQMGVDDFFTVQDSGATQYAISLGLYHTEAAAKRQIESLQQKGLRTAVISVRENTGLNTRVELTGPSDVLQKMGQELADQLKGAEQAACQLSQ